MNPIDTLTALIPADVLTAAEDDGLDADTIIRESLITFRDDANGPLVDALTEMLNNDRNTLSAIALDYSLCPLHLVDYAICFDDDEVECAGIRQCFPSHDS